MWLSNTQITRKETVLGWLEPSTGLIRMFPNNSGGIVKEVLVKEGEKVTKGQALIEISGEHTLANGDNLEELLLNEYNRQSKLLDRQLIRTIHLYDLRQQGKRWQLESENEILSQLETQISDPLILCQKQYKPAS